jgi:hypothetical protein
MHKTAPLTDNGRNSKTEPGPFHSLFHFQAKSLEKSGIRLAQVNGQQVGDNTPGQVPVMPLENTAMKR